MCKELGSFNEIACLTACFMSCWHILLLFLEVKSSSSALSAPVQAGVGKQEVKALQVLDIGCRWRRAVSFKFHPPYLWEEAPWLRTSLIIGDDEKITHFF